MAANELNVSPVRIDLNILPPVSINAFDIALVRELSKPTTAVFESLLARTPGTAFGLDPLEPSSFLMKVPGHMCSFSANVLIVPSMPKDITPLAMPLSVLLQRSSKIKLPSSKPFTVVLATVIHALLLFHQNVH